MAEKTKAELELENTELRARVAELEQADATGVTVASPRRPQLPSFRMSEGTRNDIEQVQHEIARNPRLDEVQMAEPFTGGVITVTEDGHEMPDERPVDEHLVDGEH